MSEEAAGAGEPSQRPCDIGLAGTRESQALSLVVTKLHEDVGGSSGQVSTGEEQHGSMLSA